MIGQRLGSFTIQSLLGEGGMGQVYRARDSRLDRDVAIKILPDVWLADPERRARFDREARLLAALNHPHVGAIYGVEDGDGVLSSWNWSRASRSPSGASGGRSRSQRLLRSRRKSLRLRRSDSMMAVMITPGSSLTASSPRLLFEGRYQVSDTNSGGFDVAPDGRFLMIQPTVAEQPATEFNIVLGAGSTTSRGEFARPLRSVGLA